MTPDTRLRDTGNQLLDHLAHDEYQLLAPRLQTVTLTLKQVVHEYDADISHIYFPTTALFSVLTVLEEDDPVEMATIGKEGFVGLAVSLGVSASPFRAICQMVGDSLRLPVQPFLDAVERNRDFTRLVRHYTAYTLRMTGQAIACNALHSSEARAARWLLTVHDQAGRDDFPMTQEFLAYMLGVRRQTVTVVAGALQNAGLIAYRRGVVMIKDRERLEEAACECYATGRDYYARVV